MARKCTSLLVPNLEIEKVTSSSSVKHNTVYVVVEPDGTIGSQIVLENSASLHVKPTSGETIRRSTEQCM
jgi:hypothetical protein